MSNVIELIQQPAPIVQVVQQPAMVVEVEMPSGVSSVDAPLTYDPVTQRLGFNAAQVTGLPPSATTGTAVVDADPRLTNARTPTAHKSTHATGGSDALTPADIGAEPAGTSAAGMASHLAAADPHSQYTTAAEAAAAAPVQSVAGRTGAITLAAADISDSTAAGRAVLTAVDASAQRTALGLAIGTDVQAYDADLQAIGALSGTAGLLRKTAANTWGLDTSSYLTGNQTITVSGDATGSGATAITLTLANSGVSAGTYNDSATSVRPFTVDAKGRVTSIGAAVPITPAWAAITGKPTTLSGYGITDAQPLDADLTAIAALAGTAGLLRKTAADTWTLDTAAYLTGNQSITLSGDATGSGATAISVTLANTGVSAGTYRSVTVDAKGRVTAGTNPTTLTGYGITDAQPLDADLTAIAALTHAVDNFLVSNGTAWVRETPAEALVSLGLGTPTGTGNVVRATSPTVSDATLNGQTRLAAGTEAAPAIARATELGTGMWFPSSGTVAWSTAGVERIRLSAGGLLVGTTTNTHSASIVGSGTIAETAGSAQRLVASSFDVGTAPNQIPLCQYLGSLAFTDPEGAVFRSINGVIHFVGSDAAIGHTTPSARWHVRGAGTTSATTGLRVETSGGTANLVIRDDGAFALRGGTVAVAQTGYTTPANLTTDRTFDANATTLEELADVLGTLIEDLKAKGIIAA